MESRISAWEKWYNDQEKVNAEVKMDLAIIKDKLQDIKEIKELQQEIKKSSKLYEGRKYLHTSRSDEEGEELLRS